MKTKLLLFIFSLVMSTICSAQFTATGSVSDADGEPLIGVTVVVKGTLSGTTTDFNGQYSIAIPSNEATLEFSYLGFGTQELEISSASNNNNVVLAESTNQLDEIVVSGLATNVKRSNLANSVASISSRELTGITSQPTMEGAMYGKLKGAEIRSNSGAPGGGMSIKLRGVTSIFGNQQPLYIVDGIFIDNSTISLGTNIVSAAAGGGNTATNQDDASNRVADIVTEDIESIEVLKGASAAAIYGSRAAAGVVLITTKRGKAGKPEVKLSQTIGVTTPIRLLGQRDWDAAKITQVFNADEAAKFAENGLNDYEAELYNNNGILSTTQLSYSGGSEKTNYYVSGMYKDEGGIVRNTGYEKASVRLNLDHKFTDWLDVNVSSNYVNATSDRGFFNNGNTNTTIGYALAFTRPWENLFPDASGVYPNGGAGSNFLETIETITNRENVNRFFNGVRANVRLFSTNNQNLKLLLNGGRDEYTLRTTSIFPRSLSFYRGDGTLGGVAISGNTVNKINNVSAFLVHSYYTGSGINFRTQFGMTGENFDRNTVIATSTNLNGVETSLSQAANQAVFQDVLLQKDRGFFAQEELNFKDMIIATIGLRGDKSSNNGDANKLYYYPKASLALNIHEFDFFNSSMFNQVKLRAAYGEAGTFAGFGDRFNSLNGTLLGGNSGLETSVLRGNSDVGPERQKELEVGADLALLDNRVSIEATYYNKNVDDVLLRANIPTSSGFSSKVVNAAELNNQGIELSLGVRAIDQKDFKWTTQFNWWKNTSEVTKLDIPAFNLGGFAASLGQYRIQEGASATQIVGSYDPADCEGDDCSNIDPDGDGFRVYGDAEADFNLSWINNLKYGAFDLSFVWHWKKGGDGVNLSTLLYDLAGLTWDYDDLTLDPEGLLGNGDYRTTEWDQGNAGPWIEDASYIRLREIGLYYTLPSSIFKDEANVRIGFSGRNLINIFDYNSYDPEVSNFGGNVLANSIEVTPFASSKRFNFHVTATF